MNDFEYFKKCCWKYINKWELNNWTFRIHSEKGHDPNNKFEGASISRILDNCQADVYFDSKYKHENKKGIDQSAKHEIIHCLLGKLYLMGRTRFLDVNEFEREEEELVHKLEKLL